MSLGLEREIVDRKVYDSNVEQLRDAGVVLPRLGDLADPVSNLKEKSAEIRDVDPDTPNPANLFRVHWHNDANRTGLSEIPEHIVLGPELTGVPAKIIVALGNRFPMIRAHKVLAAYGCLVPRLMSGKFDISSSRAVWPSTGNYCRGGIAISRILGCHGVAVLPEGMSKERFQWLEDWVLDKSDIVRTYGTESNVKEIYDACHQLSQDPKNVILNQFAEYGNYITHRTVTGKAFERIFNAVNADGKLNARAYVSASGSSGTLAAGDHLKNAFGTDICVVEATECPTLLYNGYGEHNIQGIGDKHIPLIHNAMNTDFVIGVSDKATDSLNLLFNTSAGRSYLSGRIGINQEELSSLANMGLSGIANVLGAIKYAKYMGLGANDAVITVATDGSELYGTELKAAENELADGKFDELKAAEVYGRYMLGAAIDHTLQLDRFGRERLFNLGYYTWVEQQGIELEDFDKRRNQVFWDDLLELVPVWDGMIDTFNNDMGQASNAA